MTAVPLHACERLLTCTRCHRRVVVAELPEQHINPDEYIGGCCLRPKERA